MISLETQDTIKGLLSTARNIAIVGLSPKISRPSFQVASYLLDAGYYIIPVNPGQTRILGQTCYRRLNEVPVSVDIVDIFRKPEDVLPVVKEAIEINAGAIWMQSGIINEEAAGLAMQAGLTVIMDRCLKTDHMNFI